MSVKLVDGPNNVDGSIDITKLDNIKDSFINTYSEGSSWISTTSDMGVAIRNHYAIEIKEKNFLPKNT